MSVKNFFRISITLLFFICYFGLYSTASATSITVSNGSIARFADYGDEAEPSTYRFTLYDFINDPHGTVQRAFYSGYSYSQWVPHGGLGYQGSYGVWAKYGTGRLSNNWEYNLISTRVSTTGEIIWLNKYMFCFGDLNYIYDTRNTIRWSSKQLNTGTYTCHDQEGKTYSYKTTEVIMYPTFGGSTCSYGEPHYVDLSYPCRFDSITLQNVNAIQSTSYGQSNSVTLRGDCVDLTITDCNFYAPKTSTQQYAREALVKVTANPTKFTATSSTFGQLDLGTGSGGEKIEMV